MSGRGPLWQDAAMLLAISETSGFSQRAGRNTGYTIHPEEILADNFALMVTVRSVESPEVLRRLREAFARRQHSIPCGRAIRHRCA
jgi:hypothetical protein